LGGADSVGMQEQDLGRLALEQSVPVALVVFDGESQRPLVSLTEVRDRPLVSARPRLDERHLERPVLGVDRHGQRAQSIPGERLTGRLQLLGRVALVQKRESKEPQRFRRLLRREKSAEPDPGLLQIGQICLRRRPAEVQVPERMARQLVARREPRAQDALVRRRRHTRPHTTRPTAGM
jgi:hypothetical protein